VIVFAAYEYRKTAGSRRVLRTERAELIDASSPECVKLRIAALKFRWVIQDCAPCLSQLLSDRGSNACFKRRKSFMVSEDPGTFGQSGSPNQQFIGPSPGPRPQGREQVSYRPAMARCGDEVDQSE